MREEVLPISVRSFGELPDDALMDVKAVALLLDAGVSTIWARVKRQEFVAPRRFGGSTRWRVGDIRAYFLSRKKAANFAETAAECAP